MSCVGQRDVRQLYGRLLRLPGGVVGALPTDADADTSSGAGVL